MGTSTSNSRVQKNWVPWQRRQRSRQLSALGWCACFLSSIDHIGKFGGQANLPPDASVIATIGIRPPSGGCFGVTAVFKVSLPGFDRAIAKELVKKADALCPYPNDVRGKVDLSLTPA